MVCGGKVTQRRGPCLVRSVKMSYHMKVCKDEGRASSDKVGYRVKVCKDEGRASSDKVGYRMKVCKDKGRALKGLWRWGRVYRRMRRETVARP